MAKTIVFKPEFEKKLKDLKIKTKFVKNFKIKEWPASEHNSVPFSIENNHACCLTTNNWFRFIQNAFNWDTTLEGYDYWKNIANS